MFCRRIDSIGFEWLVDPRDFFNIEFCCSVRDVLVLSALLCFSSAAEEAATVFILTVHKFSIASPRVLPVEAEGALFPRVPDDEYIDVDMSGQSIWPVWPNYLCTYECKCRRESMRASASARRSTDTNTSRGTAETSTSKSKSKSKEFGCR